MTPLMDSLIIRKFIGAHPKYYFILITYIKTRLMVLDLWQL